MKDEHTRLLEDVFSRGVSECIDPDNVFRKKVEAKAAGTYPRDIIIKFGIDPTRPDIHLGHAAIFQKLRKFQQLGCKVVFLVGDFTARIGDPSGQSRVRPNVEQKEVEENMKTYLEQVGKILWLDKKSFSWIRNSDWYLSPTDVAPPSHIENIKVTSSKKENELSISAHSLVGKAFYFLETRMQNKELERPHIRNVSLLGLLFTLQHITYQRLIERKLFTERIQEGRGLFMHELLYPIFQGIDSYVLNQIYGSCDLEIGGTDQTFNMLLGREVQEINREALAKEELVTDAQGVLSMALLTGIDGKEKMSKTLNNYIGITESPHEIFGKVMSIPDESITEYLELATFTPLTEVKEVRDEIKNGTRHPRDEKMRLARAIVAIYHGEQAAQKAEQEFISVFKGKKPPEDMKEILVSPGSPIVDALITSGIISSRSEFRRLVEQGAISDIDTNKKIHDPYLVADSPRNLKIGKHSFIKITMDN